MNGTSFPKYPSRHEIGKDDYDGRMSFKLGFLDLFELGGDTYTRLASMVDWFFASCRIGRDELEYVIVHLKDRDVSVEGEDFWRFVSMYAWVCELPRMTYVGKGFVIRTGDPEKSWYC